MRAGAMKAIGGGLSSIQQNGASSIASGVAAGVGAATGSGTAGGMAGALTSGLVGAGPVGLAIAGAATAASVLKESFDKLNNTVKEVAHSITDISGPAAAAKAQAEVRQLQTLLRRSQQVGDLSGQFITQDSKNEQRWEEMKTQITKLTGSTVIDIKEMGGKIIDGINRLLKFLDDSGLAKAGKAVADVNLLPLKAFLEGTAAEIKVLSEIGKWFKGKEQQNELDDMLEEIIGEQNLTDFGGGAKMFNTYAPDRETPAGIWG